MSEGPELREPDLPRTAKERPRALRTGWTTGTCASAAAKAAATALRDQRPLEVVEVALPSGARITFAVDSCTVEPARAEAVVVKDAGDDPDVTHGAHLTATVSWLPVPGIELDGGVGVGVVTKPGLGLQVGGPAINDTPRAMILQAVQEVLDPGDHGVRVVVSVPEGELMARKTTNARLGILGGISILGTTGIVRPFSTASWRASVEQAVSVMAAQEETTLVLVTGGRTEKGAMALLPDLPEVCFVEVGDFTGAAIRRARENGLRRVVFVGMVGKLTKLAAGVLMTHYTRSKVDPQVLADVTRAAGGPEELAAEVGAANTARHAYELWEQAGLLRPAGDELCRRVAEVLARFSEQELAAEVAMVDFTGRRVVAATVDGVGRVITVIGWDGSDLTAEALRTLEKATFVTGGRRHLDALPVPAGAKTVVMGNVDRALDDLARHDGDAVVLASGDPGFFGVVRALQERKLRYAVVPAVSSVALAFARAGLPWDDALVVSAHGRDLRPVVNACRAFGKVAVLTGPGAGPAQLAEALSGTPRTLVVAESLGTPDERVTEFPSSRPVTRDWSEPNVVLVLGRGTAVAPRGWLASPAAAPSGWALPDDAFVHRDGMITKAEVRAMVLPRLAPTVGTLVWDVGAGSGSVAVECARFGAAVVAVERDGQQTARIRTNATRHGVELQVVSGTAPAALSGLAAPDAVFVGGGGVDVVSAVVERRPARVVVALAAVDRFAPVRDLLTGSSYVVEGTLVSSSRIAPLPDGSSRLAATNPVLVVSGVLA